MKHSYFRQLGTSVHTLPESEHTHTHTHTRLNKFTVLSSLGSFTEMYLMFSESLLCVF